ncbi:protein NLP2-like isoform X1 [Musa acuminata AAA Group]|uniref:protein NLP2-like isoform X1 n=1 Tax=Musa acuminata AAA Group TaxID=214697 RepID=UPI0031CE2742
MDGFTPLQGGDKSPESDDLIGHSALMNIDTFTELCNPSIADQLFVQFSYSSRSNSQPQTMEVAVGMSKASNSMVGVHSSIGGNSAAQRNILQSQVISDPLHVDMTGKIASSSSFPPCDVPEADETENVIPRPTVGASLAEKLLKALSLFKESAGGGILAQAWLPLKQGNEYVLSTSYQPYLLDQVLAGYREASRLFTFSVREAPGSVLGLPGRVFISKMPEWTSNILYYNRLEYLRVDHALNYKVQGTLALPIFCPNEHSCCAVLELVTKKEKPDFDIEVASVCNALQVKVLLIVNLQAVNLKTIKAHPTQQSLQTSQESAFTEILNVLRAVCHAHMLPLALTWIPFSYFDQVMDENTKNGNKEESFILKKETMLCIRESACYVNDQRMLGFLHACSENYLQKEQGIVGKAILSYQPIFFSDIKAFDVHHYPLAHHARKFGLHAAVAIRLRSTYTGNDDYILEFFLPVNCRGSDEQQLLLNNLSVTLQRICRSLRTISDADVAGYDASGIRIDRSGIDLSSTNSSEKNSQARHGEQNSASSLSDVQNMGPDNQREGCHLGQINCGSKRQPRKSSRKLQKNVSLSDLQQYYSGTLKDAAKSIGVCPTTLKRICRENGISRWPSRKIKKVNHSVQKIQSVINSAPGILEKLRYDPTTGSLVTEVSSPEIEISSASAGQGVLPMYSIKRFENKQFEGTSEVAKCLIGDSQHMESSGQLKFLRGEQEKAHVASLDRYNEYKHTLVGGVSDLAEARCHRDGSIKGDIHSESLECHMVSRCLFSKLAMEEMQTETGACDQNAKDNSSFGYRNPCSNRPVSSSGSSSSEQTAKKSVETDLMPVETSKLPVNGGSAICVKATYKEDLVRFKFYPFMGCNQLFEEIGKRFNLSIGTFQLKYKDDEEEWVMLVTDSDLQECIEMLESLESQSVRLLVQDIPSAVGSSGSSNSLFLKS